MNARMGATHFVTKTLPKVAASWLVARSSLSASCRGSHLQCARDNVGPCSKDWFERKEAINLLAEELFDGAWIVVYVWPPRHHQDHIAVLAQQENIGKWQTGLLGDEVEAPLWLPRFKSAHDREVNIQFLPYSGYGALNSSSAALVASVSVAATIN